MTEAVRPAIDAAIRETRGRATPALLRLTPALRMALLGELLALGGRYAVDPHRAERYRDLAIDITSGPPHVQCECGGKAWIGAAGDSATGGER